MNEAFQPGASDVVVWVVESLLPHVTVVPAVTVSGVGLKPAPEPDAAVPFGTSTVDGPAGIGVVGDVGDDLPQDAAAITSRRRVAGRIMS